MIVKTTIKQIFIGISVTILVIAAFFAGFMAYLNHFAKTPAQPLSAILTQPLSAILSKSLKQEIVITIQHGQGLNSIAKTLEESGIITNKYLFIIFARYKGVNKRIKAGEYAFSRQYSPLTVLDMLIKGKVKLHRLTIPEGLNIKEIAALVEKAGFGTRGNFIKLAHDKMFIESLGVIANQDLGSNKGVVGSDKGVSSNQGVNLNQGVSSNQSISSNQGVSSNQSISSNQSVNSNRIDSLEGYLFPDTYFFPSTTDQKKIIKSMVERFNQIFIPKWQEVCKQSGFTVHEMVILASIIEKETGKASERPLISSVFHNRLKFGMRLESDPTVIYGIPYFNGNITKHDLLTMTPYNTYTIYGLPAGPIANPGQFSLKAAVFPVKSDLIFFVSKNDTSHYFSRTFQEHNLAVQKYQLKK